MLSPHAQAQLNVPDLTLNTSLVPVYDKFNNQYLTQASHDINSQVVYFNDPETIHSVGNFPKITVNPSDGPLSMMVHHQNLTGKDVDYFLNFSNEFQGKLAYATSRSAAKAGEIAAESFLNSVDSRISQLRIHVPRGETLNLLLNGTLSDATRISAGFDSRHPRNMYRTGQVIHSTNRNQGLRTYDLQPSDLYLKGGESGNIPLYMAGKTESQLGYGQNIEKGTNYRSIINGEIPGDFGQRNIINLTNPYREPFNYNLNMRTGQLYGSDVIYKVNGEITHGLPQNISVPPQSTVSVEFVKQGGIDAYYRLNVGTDNPGALKNLVNPRPPHIARNIEFPSGVPEGGGLGMMLGWFSTRRRKRRKKSTSNTQVHQRPEEIVDEAIEEVIDQGPPRIGRNFVQNDRPIWEYKPPADLETPVVPRIGRNFQQSSRPLWSQPTPEPVDLDAMSRRKDGLTASERITHEEQAELQRQQAYAQETEDRAQKILDEGEAFKAKWSQPRPKTKAARKPQAPVKPTAEAPTTSPQQEAVLLGEIEQQPGKLGKVGEWLEPRLSKFGKNIADRVPENVRGRLGNLLEEHATLGGVSAILGIAAAAGIVGGGLDHINHRRHVGRARRTHSTGAGAFLGLAAGAVTLARTGNMQNAAMGLALGVLVGNTAYDYKYRHGNPTFNIVRNSLTATAAVGAMAFTNRLSMLGIESFKTHVARNMPTAAQELLTSIKDVPNIGALLSGGGLGLLVGAMTVGTAHSIIGKALTKHHTRQRTHAGQAIVPSMLDNQAGGSGNTSYNGLVANAVSPTVDILTSGTIRTHYNMEHARRSLYE
jgi:hypothetical protein